LASLNCHVVLACRNPDKAHPNASMEVMALDLASLESARRFAEQWRTQQGGRAIDLFIANGGSTFMNPDKTADGKEITYQTNYLTHFLVSTTRRKPGPLPCSLYSCSLTLRCLPHRLPSSLLRAVVTSSSAHSPAPSVHPQG
jgi:NAD(P)-dependent dehydrogenase (short-subunit alcohol dehydrogenase family)